MKKGIRITLRILSILGWVCLALAIAVVAIVYWPESPEKKPLPEKKQSVVSKTKPGDRAAALREAWMKIFGQYMKARVQDEDEQKDEEQEVDWDALLDESKFEDPRLKEPNNVLLKVEGTIYAEVPLWYKPSEEYTQYVIKDHMPDGTVAKVVKIKRQLTRRFNTSMLYYVKSLEKDGKEGWVFPDSIENKENIRYEDFKPTKEEIEEMSDVIDKIAERGGPEAVELLIKALNNEIAVLRRKAALSLGRLKDWNALGALNEVAEKDNDPKVRLAAKTAIKMIKPH